MYFNRGSDIGRFNDSVNEWCVFFAGEDGALHVQRDIVVYRLGEPARNISYLST